MSATPTADEARAPLSWPARALALVGWGVVVVGVLGATDRVGHYAGPVPWMRLATWMIGAAAVHDLVIAPLVTIVALVVALVLPRSARGPVAGGLIVSGALVAVSYPRLRGDGALPNNVSVLPGDAPRDLAAVLAVVWVAVVVTALVRVVRTRSG